MRLHATSRMLAVVVALTVACGGPPLTPRPPAPVAPQCRIVPGPGSDPDTITIALFGAADPGFAPLGRNGGEQLLFDHLYDTLIELDCLDGVGPGLAHTWSRGDDGRRWSFEIRDDARFWDGSPLRAEDVVMSWERTAVEPMRLYALVDSISATAERIVEVHFGEPHTSVPRALSSPAFAVTKRTAASQWLLGTGRYRVVAPDGQNTGAQAMGPVLRFVAATGVDARDLLERAVDVMVTTDPAVIGYARGQRELATVALEWDKTYVLLSTSRLREMLRGGAVGSVTPDFCDGLARDAVNGVARGFLAPVWWEDAAACERSRPGDVPALPRGAYDAPDRRRILFDSSDAVARSLAERIVALASSTPTATDDAAILAGAVPGLDSDWPRTIAEGVPPGEFAQTLRHGDDFAYVIAIPRRPPDACYGTRELLDRAPWLGSIGDAVPTLVIPLVDTRPHAIARRDKVGLAVDGYGVVRVMIGGNSQ